MKRKLYTISILWAAALLALSMVFVQDTYAGDGFFSNIKRFGKHTYAGPFDISKLSRKKAKEKLQTDFAELEQNLQIELLVQDQTAAVPSESVTFDIDATLGQASSGQDNALVANVSRDGLRTVLKQNFSSLSFDENELEVIALKIEEYVRTGIMPIRIHLPEYVPGIYSQTETIASATYNTDSVTRGLQLAMDDLDGLEILPNTTFSFREFMEGKEMAVATDEELTIAASMLYAAALQTNWIIDERNISSELTAEVQPGFEAAINRNLGLDFMFSNPNQTVFTLHTKRTGGQIELTVEGLPFIHTYEPVVEKLTTYEPRTVVRYSAFVNPGAMQLVDKGKKGMEVVVKRNVMLNGTLEEYEDISSDFYVPQPRVERHHLIQPETTTDPSNPGDSGQQGNSDGSSVGDGASGDHNNSNTNSSGNNDYGSSSSGGKDSSGSAGTHNGSAGGNKGSNSNGNEVIYDKGGKPMKFDENGNPID